LIGIGIGRGREKTKRKKRKRGSMLEERREKSKILSAIVAHPWFREGKRNLLRVSFQDLFLRVEWATTLLTLLLLGHCL
jgi:hypothetical protein